MNGSVWALLLGAAALLAAVEFAAPRRAARAWLALERAVAGLRTRRVTLAGFTIPYLDGGRGETLVLIHGFGGDKDNFTRVARLLTPHLRVVVPDVPGFGDSGRDPAASYRIDAQVARLREFIDALGLGPVHLGGNSMGGFIAAQYAATYPDGVRSLWLLDPAGCADAYENALMRTYQQTGQMPLLVRSASEFGGLLAAVMHRVPWIPHSLRHALAERAAADFALHTRIFREIGVESPTLEDRYGAIRAPTLIVWGRDDQVLNPAAAATLRARIPRSAVQLLADTGHLPMVERPRAVAEAYLRFLAAPPD